MAGDCIGSKKSPHWAFILISAWEITFAQRSVWRMNKLSALTSSGLRGLFRTEQSCEFYSSDIIMAPRSTWMTVVMRKNSRSVDRKGGATAAHQRGPSRRARSCSSYSTWERSAHFISLTTTEDASGAIKRCVLPTFSCIIHQLKPSYPACPVRKTRSLTEPLFSCTSQSEDWTGSAALPGFSIMEKASAKLADDHMNHPQIWRFQFNNIDFRVHEVTQAFNFPFYSLLLWRFDI